MRIGIIGNGLAGVMAAKSIRERDGEVPVELFAEENVHYYPRPNLIEYLAGTLPYERLFAFPEGWYAEKGLEVHLGNPAVGFDPHTLEVEDAGGRKRKFDALLLAGGAKSALPPIKGVDRSGVFSLRTLKEAQDILAFIENRGDLAVIGGGLLGLEIARALNNRGVRVSVVEFFSRLLPRQLDEEGAALLRSQVEVLGIDVKLGLATEEIVAKRGRMVLRFKGGSEHTADTVIIAAGVSPRLELAEKCGLTVGRGIVVDDYLRTSRPGFYGAGDAIEHKGKTYGIIPAAFEQARVAAVNILGGESPYKGTVPSNTLKVAGVVLTSVGTVNPEGGGYQEFRKLDRDKGVYKKTVLRQGRLVGAIWLGTKRGAAEITKAAIQGRDVDRVKETLLEDSFDFTLL